MPADSGSATCLPAIGAACARIGKVTACSSGANDIGEILGNLTGGVRRGAIYEGRLEAFVNLDLEKIAGWSGATVHANAYQIHGRGLSANDLGKGSKAVVTPVHA